ncbi:hypothetical protein JX265_003338 [Neoarthrinium moseri]|uniref:AB hydrolase-1 domain-containing protein n=1 Tax=Neoarthrinium moseri TaxID=1658444 RepID=A0A9P9WS33_9PEZI|nr:hypothetical protein JX265_003338 [Neoarthrinium moseri]
MKLMQYSGCDGAPPRKEHGVCRRVALVRGTPLNAAAKGYSVTERAAQHQKGDVVDAADWLTVANGKAKAAFHGPEMAEDEADQYLASLLPQSLQSLTGGPSVGVEEITVPIYYILCEKDQTISPATQQDMISTIPSLKRVLRNPGGHAACVTEVEKLVKPIIEIADEVEKEPKV